MREFTYAIDVHLIFLFIMALVIWPMSLRVLLRENELAMAGFMFLIAVLEIIIYGVLSCNKWLELNSMKMLGADIFIGFVSISPILLKLTSWFPEEEEIMTKSKTLIRLVLQ